jgi:hypothetical protein
VFKQVLLEVNQVQFRKTVGGVKCCWGSRWNAREVDGSDLRNLGRVKSVVPKSIECRKRNFEAVEWRKRLNCL